MTLKEITQGFLFEGVSNSEINDAIENHKYIVVNYQGTDGTHTGNRMIQPVAFGATSSGNPVIRAFEDFGDTKTAVPRWKYLRVDRISSWRDTGKTFDEPEALFNPDDDKTMSVVWKIAKFGDDDNDNISDPPHSSPKKKEDEIGGVFKTETERKLEKLRKQLKNPLTLSDFKATNGFDGTSNGNQTSGPKTNKDVKNGTDDVYTNDYNYNVFDNSLDALGSKAKRNGNYYFQKRKNGKFTKGSVLDDEPLPNDTKETNDYLNRDNGNNEELDLNKLRKMLGDTSKPITLQDLKDRLGKR